MKLALGTVQFGLDYGIANSSGKTPRDEAARIVERARQFGMDTLDTAAAYGESEQVLGDIGVAGWNVVTKVPSHKNRLLDGRRWVVDQVKRSLAVLRAEHLDAVLLHDASNLFDAQGPEIVAGLQQVKAEGLASKIGYSIYSPDLLASLLKVMSPDLIQAPFNVLDQRLVKTGWLKRLTDMGVEVHVRSIFLQGLLLMPPSERPFSFNRWRDLWTHWDTLVERHGGSALKACLGFVKQQPDLSRCVVGVESVLHLEQLVSAWQSAIAVDATELCCDDRLLIEPMNWKQA